MLSFLTLRRSFPILKQYSSRFSSSTSSTVTEIKKVGVIGLGLMGHGVAQVTAQAGYEVVGIESNSEALTVGTQRIEQSLKKLIAKDVKLNRLTESEGAANFAEIMSRIHLTTDINSAHDCDLVIEAIVENMDIKIQFYKHLANKVKPNAIFASNTSSLQITQMAIASGRPQNFVGLHFFNPVQMMKLVEIIQTKQTNPAIVQLMSEYCHKINKTSVHCGDTPGFIVNRLLVPYLAEAIAMIDRGDATIPDIDISMQLGAGHPMGPIQLADYVGLDTCLHILEGWVKDYPNERFFVPNILRQKVQQGDYGRKTGKGFYLWNGDKVGKVA